MCVGQPSLTNHHEFGKTFFPSRSLRRSSSSENTLSPHCEKTPAAGFNRRPLDRWMRRAAGCTIGVVTDGAANTLTATPLPGSTGAATATTETEEPTGSTDGIERVPPNRRMATTPPTMRTPKTANASAGRRTLSIPDQRNADCG